MIKKSETIQTPQKSIHFTFTFKCLHQTKMNLPVKQQEYYGALKYNKLETAGRLFISTSQTLLIGEIKEEKGGEVGDGSGYHQGAVVDQSISSDDLEIDPLLNLN